MATITEDSVKKTIARSKLQLFFSGGHGGLGTYDGKGGPMVKDGGPMDRLFILRSGGSLFDLGGDHGLDISYGSLRMITGALSEPVKIEKRDKADTVVRLHFTGNTDDNAVELTGGIPELELPSDTVLFRGTLEPSEIVWIVGDVSKKKPRLPYTGLHKEFSLHPAIAERFDLNTPVQGLAVSAWTKHSPTALVFSESDRYGTAFKAHQHIASLRIFVEDD